MIKVPDLENSNIKEIALKMGLKEKPFLIKCKPEKDFEVNFCFPNVEKKIAKNGGKIIYGWQLWEHPFMIEAEFHSVWKSDNGEIIDVTPKENKLEKILFIEDPIRKYEGTQIDNFRFKTTENNLIDDFINLGKAKFRLLSKAENIDKYQVQLNNHDYRIYEHINHLMVAVNQMILEGKSRNSNCFCGETKKYKKCHGKDLNIWLKKIK